MVLLCNLCNHLIVVAISRTVIMQSLVAEVRKGVVLCCTVVKLWYCTLDVEPWSIVGHSNLGIFEMGLQGKKATFAIALHLQHGCKLFKISCYILFVTTWSCLLVFPAMCALKL